MTILDKIITEKRKEVQQLKKEIFAHVPTKSNTKTFTEQIKSKQTMGIIAEIKRASPSKGMINADVDPVKQAIFYEENGANAISILTDAPFFKGSMEDLKAVRKAVDLPILCKDFIIDPIQIDQAKAAGANIILLIAAALSKKEFIELYQYASSKGLEVLCDVHDKEEMNFVLYLIVTIIGINNLNL